MNKYLQLFRLGNCVMGILGVLVAAFIAVGPDITNHVTDLIVACAVVIVFIAGGNSINDYIDREIDKTAHPERPIPSGRMNAKTALYIGCIALFISVLISLISWNITTTIIVSVAAILMVSYEVYLKQRGFLGNVTIAVLTGMLFLLGGSVTGNLEGTVAISLMAMLVSIGREISKDIQDMDSDEGRNTLPMRIGVRNAGILAAIFFIAGPILSILPLITHTFGPLYMVVFLPDVIFIYCAIILFKDPRKSQKYAKYAMMIALIAFILGAI